MMNYLNKYSIITNCQHGFRAGKSTQSAAISFVENLHKSLDDGLFVAGLFFDLTRAFDCLIFKFILDKLYSLGFRDVFLDWIESYLSNRCMVVKIHECLSSKCCTSLGVPQGSVLGPLLFILFINDLPYHITADKLTIFAEDTSLAVAAGSSGELMERCTLVITEFNKWCVSNALILNVDKTECLFFNQEMSNNPHLNIPLGNTSILPKNSVKFLGVFMDNELRWSDHVDHVSKKLNSAYYAINKIRDCLPFSSIMQVYYSLVFSHLSYNIVLWGNTSDSRRAFIFQKRIIRMIFGLGPKDSCRPIFVKHEILTLPCIYLYKCLLHVKENESNFATLTDFHSYNTRNSSVLFVPRHGTAKYEKSPSYQFIKIFNHLPVEVRRLCGTRFRKVVKQILLMKGYYAVGEYFLDRFA